MNARGDSALQTYRALPVGTPLGGIVLLAGLRGLSDEVRGLAKRLAAEGYCVYVPEISSALGIGPGLGERAEVALSNGLQEPLDDAVREEIERLETPQYQRWLLQSLRAVVDMALDGEGVGGRVAVIGTGMGGRDAYALAAFDHRVRLAISYDAGNVDIDAVEDIKGAAVSFYGIGTAVSQVMPELRAAMRRAGVPFCAKAYPHADTTSHVMSDRPSASDVASDLWERSLALLRLHLA